VQKKLIPDYCYIEIPGAVYIVHTKEPLFIGRVWMYKDAQELKDQLSKLDPYYYVVLPGYNIMITTWTYLGRLAESENTKSVMDGMLDFFVESRVNKHQKFYEKFRAA